MVQTRDRYSRVVRNEGDASARDYSLLPYIVLVVVLAVALAVPFACSASLMHRFAQFKLDLAESMSQTEASNNESGGCSATFADGSVLELWPVDLDGNPETPGTLIRYTRPDGSVFSYDTDRINYASASRAIG